jgi:hypothetical protein
MSLVTSLYNKVQYLASTQISDPEADAFAKQKAEQLKQDAETKKREEKAAKAKAEAEAKTLEEKEAAANLASRSKFDSSQLIADSANGIIKATLILIAISILFYGGHLAANQAIGYGVPFRILSFIYGCLTAFYGIPMMIYKIYVKGETLQTYSFLPISTYVPNGTLESIFFGPFCYQENEASVAARAAVETLYSNAYKKSTQVVQPT